MHGPDEKPLMPGRAGASFGSVRQDPLLSQAARASTQRLLQRAEVVLSPLEHVLLVVVRGRRDRPPRGVGGASALVPRAHEAWGHAFRWARWLLFASGSAGQPPVLGVRGQARLPGIWPALPRTSRHSTKITSRVHHEHPLVAARRQRC